MCTKNKIECTFLQKSKGVNPHHSGSYPTFNTSHPHFNCLETFNNPHAHIYLSNLPFTFSISHTQHLSPTHISNLPHTFLISHPHCQSSTQFSYLPLFIISPYIYRHSRLAHLPHPPPPLPSLHTHTPLTHPNPSA